MIIAHSSLQLQAEHHQLELVTQQSQQSSRLAFQAELGSARLFQHSAPLTGAPAVTAFSPGSGFDPVAQESASARLFQALIDAISGRLSRLSLHSRARPSLSQPTTTAAADAQPPNPEPGRTEDAPAGTRSGLMPDPLLGRARRRAIQVEVRVSETRLEEECTRFCAAGSITTRDGETLDLEFNLQLYRHYQTSREFTQRQEVRFTDPLVLNFDGAAAELSTEKFAFDLDADGSDEWISMLQSNSGLLALDRDGDGRINDGSELFGAQSGNGFADLVPYDSDQNGFIDAGDPIFEQLRVWRKTEHGERLETLAEHDVGALYLGATETPFELKDEHNQSLGRVRQSGIFVTEAGTVGSVQQIDLAV